MHPVYRHLLSLALLAALVLAVHYGIGWGQLLSPWQDLRPLAVVLAVALMLLSYGLRAARIHDYFRPDTDGRFAATLKLVLVHNVLNNLLPMRSGEVSFPVLMARYFAVGPLRSVPTLLWFRLLDLHTVLAAGLAAWWATQGGLLPAAALAAWLALPPLGFRLHRSLALRLQGQGRLRQTLAQALAALPDSAAAFTRAWAWTLINWAVKLAVYAWLLTQFMALGGETALLGAMGGELSSVLPVHGLAGAGTYEAGVVAALALAGIAATAALQAAVNLHLFVLGTSLAGGALSLLIRRPEHGPVTAAVD